MFRNVSHAIVCTDYTCMYISLNLHQHVLPVQRNFTIMMRESKGWQL